VSGETIVDASADRVWEVVARRFERIGEWATAIPASRVDPEAVSETDAPVAGRVCATGLRIFPDVRETIVAYDDRARSLVYVGEGMPAFVADARNRWHVSAIDDRRARVSVEATLETRGILGRLLSLPLRLRLQREGRRMLEDLKHYVERGRPLPRKQRRLEEAQND
jgi:hypothetical protein